jgi:Fic family protein
MEHSTGGISKPDTSKGFLPTLEVDQEVRETCRSIDRLDGELERLQVTPYLVQQMLRWARIRNAHSSTALEGNPTPLDRAAALAEPSVKPRDPHEVEIRRLMQYYRSLEKHRGAEATALTPEEILGLHRTLLEGVLDGKVGAWKTHPNYIAGPFREIVFRPTPPARVLPELKALLQWYGNEGQSLHPAVRVGVFFQEFENIHPFPDGNGRVGRALCQRLLVGEGLPNALLVPLDAVITREPDVYYEVLRLTNERDDFTFFARYFVVSLARAYREAKDRAAVQPLVEGLPPGVPRAILQHLLVVGSGAIRSADLQEALGYSRTAVVLGLRELEKRGIVASRGGGRSSHYVLRDEFVEGLFPFPTRRASAQATDP